MFGILLLEDNKFTSAFVVSTLFPPPYTESATLLPFIVTLLFSVIPPILFPPYMFSIVPDIASMFEFTTVPV